MPGAFISMSSTVRPSYFESPRPGTRTMQKYQFERWAIVVQIFWPFTT
jgi:hypothetical protein